MPEQQTLCITRSFVLPCPALSNRRMQAVRAFFDAFHDCGWERFNSDKRCAVAYARIQGRPALVHHFQNSSLMHEDPRCRPVLINLSNGTPELKPFPPPSRCGAGSPAARTPAGTPVAARGHAGGLREAALGGGASPAESPRALPLPARLPCDSAA